MKLQDILTQSEIELIKTPGFNLVLHEDLFEKLFDFYSDVMPYGTQKARTGDPYLWIQERLENEIINH